MAKEKKKITSIQKDLMVGLTSSLMFYIIAELAGIVDKLLDCLPRGTLLFLKVSIAVLLWCCAMWYLRNKFYD